MECQLKDLCASRSDFGRFHEATRSWSPFNFPLSARTLRNDSVLGVVFRRRAEISGTGEVSISDLEGRDRVGFLFDELGLSEEIALQLPPDVAMPSPPKPGP